MFEYTKNKLLGVGGNDTDSEEENTPQINFPQNIQANDVDWVNAPNISLGSEGDLEVKSEQQEHIEEIQSKIKNVNTDDEVEEIMYMLDSLVEIPEKDNPFLSDDTATYKDEIEDFRSMYPKFHVNNSYGKMKTATPEQQERIKEMIGMDRD